MKKKFSLGIELGSTRIKAILIDENNKPLASGGFTWNNKMVDGYWSYSIEEIWEGIAASYSQLKSNVKNKYGITLTKFKAIGISAMMHGYLVFNSNNDLLVPFRTWRNTYTKEASEKLSSLFNFPIPQRYSISHFYQAILNSEKHIQDIDKMTTLAGYVHYTLTNNFVIGIGDASGMFPIDCMLKDYNQKFINQFDNISNTNFSVKNILPKVLLAGNLAGTLTQKGAFLLDKDGDLLPNIPMCPPEGDAETGMVSTNSIKVNTGNVSAGTSVFAMIVLEKQLENFYDKLDFVTTPDGYLTAMVHSNNCTGDYDAWLSIFKEVININGGDVSTSQLYDNILNQALLGDKDCGGLLSYNYLSGEHITDFNDGRPLFTRTLDSNFTLANFMRTQLYTSLCSLRIGLDLLYEKENIKVDSITGHGGFFKTPIVGQTIMANATHTPINVVESSGEGGAWGIAILANYVGEVISLSEYLDTKVFNDIRVETIVPTKEESEGFNKFYELYKRSFALEKAAIDCLN
jgi:sugar (pentulose or hexulose) kinase